MHNISCMSLQNWKLLKYLLVWCWVASIFFASCKADSIKFSILTTQTLNWSATWHLDNSYSWHMCLVPIPTASSSLRIYNSEQDLIDNTNYLTWLRYWLYCRTWTIYLKNNSTSSITYNLYNISRITTWFDSSSCDDPYTSLECQQEYSLIPISSVDANYCSSNNLCSSSGCDECPEFTGDSNWSALYINNVLHDSRPIVRVDIPSEIDRDYSTTPNEFDLNISWYNVDTEWMDGVLSVQNYKPTTDDFSALVWEALPKFWWLLAVCLFVILVFYMIKKVF